MLQLVTEPVDKYAWLRQKQARELDIPESELADEPDRMPDGSDEQGYDK